MKNYIQYQLKEADADRVDIYLANLAEFGFDGFEEIENGLIATALEGQVNENEVAVWLRSENLLFERTVIPPQNWNALWESNFSPVVVEDFAGVRAHFHPPNPNVQYDLLITPKMSFGTGHHATTWQMMKMMQHLPIGGSRVFDFGTGTGILAILAEKMGATEVEAIDNDEWSITNALENIEANLCNRIKLYKADILPPEVNFDIVLANINKHIILENAVSLSKMVKIEGFLLLSGLLLDDEADINSSIVALGFVKSDVSENNGWIALLFQKKA